MKDEEILLAIDFMKTCPVDDPRYVAVAKLARAAGDTWDTRRYNRLPPDDDERFADPIDREPPMQY